MDARAQIRGFHRRNVVKRNAELDFFTLLLFKVQVFPPLTSVKHPPTTDSTQHGGYQWLFHTAASFCVTLYKQLQACKVEGVAYVSNLKKQKMIQPKGTRMLQTLKSLNIENSCAHLLYLTQDKCLKTKKMQTSGVCLPYVN